MAGVALQALIDLSAANAVTAFGVFGEQKGENLVIGLLVGGFRLQVFAEIFRVCMSAFSDVLCACCYL